MPRNLPKKMKKTWIIWWRKTGTDVEDHPTFEDPVPLRARVDIRETKTKLDSQTEESDSPVAYVKEKIEPGDRIYYEEWVKIIPNATGFCASKTDAMALLTQAQKDNPNLVGRGRTVISTSNNPSFSNRSHDRAIYV